MRQNLTLDKLHNNMPDYNRVRELFFEIYPVVVQIGGSNFSALTKYNLMPPMPSDILAIYLSGVALGRASELSEKGIGAWGVIEAWALVQDDLWEIMPSIAMLPAPAEIEVKAPPKRRKRA